MSLIKNRFVLALLFISSFVVKSEAVIHEAKNFGEVESYLVDLNGRDLALFNPHMTLTIPSDAAFQIPNMRAHHELMRLWLDQLSPKEKELFFQLAFLRRELMPISDRVLPVLQELKEKGIKTMGLSNALTGSLSDISSVEDKVNENLKAIGIDFESSFDSVEVAFLDSKPFRDHTPVLKHGVLFTNGFSRQAPVKSGELLVAFLKTVNFHPEKIVFVDHRLKNLEDVERALQEAFPEISFVGIHTIEAREFYTDKVSESEFAMKWVPYLIEAKIVE